MKAYLCSGWFSEEQEKARLIILKSLESSGIDFYSPKDHGLYIPGKTSPTNAFETNIKEIENSDFLIVSTVGKDMGTVFECGCAYILEVPIVYFWENKSPLNLMLSESATAVLTSEFKLHAFLYEVNMKGTSFLQTKQPYKGEIE